MKNVLLILESIAWGGIESTVLKMVQELNKTGKIHCDIFYANSAFKLDKPFIDAGCKIYHSDFWRDEVDEHSKNLLEVLKNEENPVYDIIHGMAFRHEMMIKNVYKAAKNGQLEKSRLPKRRILQSHMACNLNGATRKYYFRNLAAKILVHTPFSSHLTDRIGVSKMATDFMFWKTEKSEVLPNFVEFEKFIAARETRKKTSENSFSIGSCGRLTLQKNPLFLADAVIEVAKRNPEIQFEFHWFGEGDLRNETQKKFCDFGELEFDESSTRELGHLGFGAQEKVEAKNVTAFFYGIIMHGSVPELISKNLDIFAFPSIYEGLGISLLEADATGIPCISSTNVPTETNISKNIQRLPARFSPKRGSNKTDVQKWANAFEEIREKLIEDKFIRSKISDFENSMYSIKNAAKIWEEFYLR